MDHDEATAPLAVVGMASRFAGGASSPEKLWDMIVEKRTGWNEIPSSRFELGGVYHPNGERIGTVCFSFSLFFLLFLVCFQVSRYNFMGRC